MVQQIEITSGNDVWLEHKRRDIKKRASEERMRGKSGSEKAEENGGKHEKIRESQKMRKNLRCQPLALSHSITFSVPKLLPTRIPAKVSLQFRRCRQNQRR